MKPKEVQNKEELEKFNWENDDMVFVKETNELLMYYNGYWLDYLADDL